ncbi:MAG: DUF4276 family protein [Pirellula sp.]|jgi:hypothetical protein|nr:DUF4276 family protein [Pirellula sp.]
MIVFLTEEESMKVTLERFLARFWPTKVAGVDWIALSFQGKNDLEKNIVPKMKNWRYGTPHFVVMRDQDGEDCKLVKSKLCEIATKGVHPFTVRVVCNELESWFLGELDSVETAYPASKASRFKNVAKFRVPDALGNANEELEKLVKVPGKVGRADAIARVFDPAKCVSKSFQVFWSTANTLLT